MEAIPFVEAMHHPQEMGKISFFVSGLVVVGVFMGYQAHKCRKSFVGPKETSSLSGAQDELKIDAQKNGSFLQAETDGIDLSSE